MNGYFSDMSDSYLFNPFTVATCLGRPTSVFTNCAILFSVSNAALDRPFSSMLALSLASYLSLYPGLLLPPLLTLCYDQRARHAKQLSASRYCLTNIAIFLAGLAWLLYISHALMGGSWEYLSSTYGVHLLLPDLTPNVGLWWYFFIEMFDSFREFFLGVFWLHLGSYVGGMSLRMRKQPVFVVTTLLGIFAIFKPYPSVSDTSLYFAMLPLYRHIYPRTLRYEHHLGLANDLPVMRYTFLATSTVLYATFLGPAFYYLWIYAGSGNANFFYAITLVWSLGLTVILTDSLFAILRDEVEVERPELKGKDIRTI